MKTYKINTDNLTIEQLKLLEGLVEESNKEKACTPKDGELYYYLSDTGSIYFGEWIHSMEYKNRYEIGNYFPTQEEAKDEREHRCVEVVLKRFAEENNDWEDDGCYDKYILCCDINCGKVWVDYYNTNKTYTDVTFSSEEIAEKQ